MSEARTDKKNARSADREELKALRRELLRRIVANEARRNAERRSKAAKT